MDGFAQALLAGHWPTTAILLCGVAFVVLTRQHVAALSNPALRSPQQPPETSVPARPVAQATDRPLLRALPKKAQPAAPAPASSRSSDSSSDSSHAA